MIGITIDMLIFEGGQIAARVREEQARLAASLVWVASCRISASARGVRLPQRVLPGRES